MPNVPSPPLPPPPPPPLPLPSPPPPITTTTATTTAAVATAPNPPASHSSSKVLFRDNTVQPFELNFYVDLGLLKIIGSSLDIKTPFKLISLITSYLYKNSLKYKAESLLKIIKNINNAVAR